MADLIDKRVVFHSLTRRPDLNGRSGLVKTFDASRGRVGVHIDGGSLLAVKPANLSLPTEGTAAAGSETGMELLVAAVQMLCMSDGPGWRSAKAVHAKLQEEEQWAGTSFGEVQAACAIVARSQGAPASSAVAATTPLSSPNSALGASTDGSIGPACMSQRVAEILQTLRAAKPGTEQRRAHVEELLLLLKEHGSKRNVVNALIDGEGPQILYSIENSMQGDWKTDARNGTLTKIGELMRLPGPAGLAIAQYCSMTTAKVQAAAKNQHDKCDHH